MTDRIDIEEDRYGYRPGSDRRESWVVLCTVEGARGPFTRTRAVTTSPWRYDPRDTAAPQEETGRPPLSAAELLRRFPADPRLMSSPEGDKRGLERLRRAVQGRWTAGAVTFTDWLASPHGKFAADRHPATLQVLRWLYPNDRRPAAQFLIAHQVWSAAVDALQQVPDGPELTAGLRKLLEAKDCLVRASMGATP